MRKTMGFVLGLVFSVGVVAGYDTTPVTAAGGGGGGNCFYMCTCEGTPLECCSTPWGTWCFVSDEFACTQQYDC